MKSAKKIFTFLFFSIAVGFTGCSGPVGSLLTSNVADHIRVEPKRFVYESNEKFIPADEEEGVEVYAVFKGIEKLIAIEDVEIIVNDTGWGDIIVLNESEKKEGLLLTAGIKDIVISYKSMETFYRIYVGAKAGDGGGGGGGPIIIIDWEW
jgi:hypothetical protein